MLTDAERRTIETHAIAELRAQWGRSEARRLGDVIAEVNARMSDGTLGQASFVEEATEMLRLAHAADIARRDEALPDVADHIGALQLIDEMEGAAGIRAYAAQHGLDLQDCIRALDGPEAAIG